MHAWGLELMKIFILVVSLSVNKIMTNHQRSRSLVLVNTDISKAREGYQGEQFAGKNRSSVCKINQCGSAAFFG